MFAKFSYFLAIALVAFCCVDAIAADGPFGIIQGMYQRDLEALGLKLQPQKGVLGTFELSAAPKTHPSFESYFVVLTPKAGVCRIRAIGFDMEANSHGDQLRSAFEKLVEQLSEVYGPNEIVDYLVSGSIWNEPQDWMMGLLKKERTLQAEWDADRHSMLKNGVETIILSVRALNTSKGFLSLQYDFSNYNDCKAEIDTGQKNTL